MSAAWYRKKPVYVRAFQVNKEDNRFPEWLCEYIDDGVMFRQDEESKWKIKTLEGEMEVEWGDFVIQGIQEEIYPCKPDIFRDTYDPAPRHPHDVQEDAMHIRYGGTD